MKYKVKWAYPSGSIGHTVIEADSADSAAEIADKKAARHYAELVSVDLIKPLTVNDALNAMSAEEKAKAILQIITETCEDGLATEEELTKYLASPYDGGKAQEGAER